jgi:hypothetical protein
MSFDPYLQWLGIRSPQRPPNHYQLLGLELFEADRDVIATAADRQMAHVRKYQSGPHSSLSQRLLNELAAAKLCLLKPETKSQYDAALRNTLAASINGMPRRRTFGVPLAIAAGAVAVAGVTITYYLTRGTPERRSAAISHPDIALRTPRESLPVTKPVPIGDQPPNEAAQQAEENPQTQTDEKRGEQSADPAGAAALVGEPASESQRDLLVRVHEGPAAEDDSKRPAPSAQPEVAPWELPRDAVRRPFRLPDNVPPSDVRNLYRALQARDVEAARRALEKVRGRAASQAEREEADRLEMLTDKIAEFWGAVDQAIEKEITRGATLEFRGIPVVVDARTDSQITLRAAAGQTKTYSIERDEMDPDLAVGLARVVLDQGGAAADLPVGLFLHLDKDGDVREARELLAEAVEQGFPVEVLFAMPGPGSGAPRSKRQVEDESTAATASPPEARPRQPIPSAHAQAEALDEIQRILAEDYARRDSDGQARLAAKLVNLAHSTRNDVAARYALYQESIKLGVASGAADTVLQALDGLAYNFDVDEHALRLTELDTLIGTVRGTPGRQAICESLLEWAERLSSDDQLATADKYASVAIKTARAARDPELVKRAISVRDRIARLDKRYAAARPAIEKLAMDPEDEQANGVVGEYYCFHKHQFSRGIAHLAKGTPGELKDTALMELRPPSTPEDQVALGDRWWELAEHQKDRLLQTGMRNRAVHWYESALPQLNGLTRQKVESRLLAQADPSGREPTARRLARKQFFSLTRHPWEIQWWTEGNPHGPVATWSDVRFQPEGKVTYRDSKSPSKVVALAWESTPEGIRIAGPDRVTVLRVQDDQLVAEQYSPKDPARRVMRRGLGVPQRDSASLAG